jgi:uncharacterized membrane protein
MKENEHILEQHDPERRDFQIERNILFTDAVFAIAITLLVIEIKASEAHHLDVKEQILQLLGMRMKFIGFMMSFLVVAIYWRSHHRVFGFVHNFTEKLIWLNMLFLFPIVLMPFSSAYLSENYLQMVPFVVYNCNVALTGLINYIVLRYVFNGKNNIVKNQPSAAFLSLFYARATVIPIFFTCCALGALVGLPPNPMVYMLLFPLLILIGKYNARKYKAQPVVSNPGEE